jgi:HK97 family phage portal protein
MGFFTNRISQKITNSYDTQESIKDWISGNDVINNGNINISGNASLKFTAVFSCCRVLAETFASVPIFEYKKQDEGDRLKTDDTGLYDLLHNAPNDEMSAYNAKEMAMYQINLGGNVVFSRKKNRFGEITELYPHEWKCVDIDRDLQCKKLTYTIQNELKQRTRSEVFHVAGPSLNGVIGMSPIEYAAAAVRLGLSYEKFATNYYKNGAFPTGFFEHPGSLNDTAYERLKQSLKKEWAGMQNIGNPMLLEDNLKFTPSPMKLADAELLASKKFQVEDICRIYRVPLHLVQNLDKATNNNIEHQSLEFVMYTMLPHFKRWEDAINTQLLTKAQRKEGYYFEFNISSLLRGDQKSMAEAFAIGRQWGWLSVNDIRRLMNMNRIENGDVYLQPMNMIEAGTKVEDHKKEIIDSIYKLLESKEAK